MAGGGAREPEGVMVCAWTGAVMLMESCDPSDECEWDEDKDAEELCRLGRRRWVGGVVDGKLHPCK